MPQRVVTWSFARDLMVRYDPQTGVTEKFGNRGAARTAFIIAGQKEGYTVGSNGTLIPDSPLNAVVMLP